MEERGITKEQFSGISDVSITFISDLKNGKSNPTFWIMEGIVDAMNEPLPWLLGKTDLDSQSLKALAVGKPRGIAEGYERVSLMPPSHQAYLAKQWVRKFLKTEKKLKTETH